MHSSLSTSLLEPLWMRWAFYIILTWAPFIGIVHFYNPSNPNLTTSSTSSPYFSRSTQWSTASPWSTPGSSQYDVDLRLDPKSSNGSLHQLSTRLLRRLLHHTGGKLVLVSVVILFLPLFSACLISGHLSSGRSVEAASTGSIWHFQVSPGWKKTTN